VHQENQVDNDNDQLQEEEEIEDNVNVDSELAVDILQEYKDQQ
jgi:hypothetical protein